MIKGKVKTMDIHDESILSEPESEMMVNPELNEMPIMGADASFGENGLTGLEGGVNEINGSDVERMSEELSSSPETSEIGQGDKVSFCGKVRHFYCPDCGHTWHEPGWPSYCPKWGCTGRPQEV
jgi:hypothetical protein